MKKKTDKTNTESAASSSSNQSSVMGNAGLGVCARLKNCPSFSTHCLVWKRFDLGGFWFSLFSDTREVQCVWFHTRREGTRATRVSTGFSHGQRWYVVPSHLFVLFSPCHLKWLLCLLMHFLFFSFFLRGGGGLSAPPPVITSTSLAPLKYEAIAFLCQMSYRLTFKFLSEQSWLFKIFFSI